MYQKGFAHILILAGLILLALLISGAYFLGTKVGFRTQPPPTTMNQSHSSLANNKSLLPITQVLINQVPNFDNLTLADLPHFTDYRHIFKYGENYVIVGYSRIIEYDPRKKEIVRQDDNSTIKTIDSGTIIGDFLYVTGDIPGQSDQDFPSKRQLWKIDLRTGNLVKVYFPNDQRHFGNLLVTSKGNDLWLSSWDGVMRINTLNDTIENIDYQKIGLKAQTCPAGVYIDNGTVTILSNCVDLGIAIYDENTNSWQFRSPVAVEEYNKHFYVKPADYRISLPNFLIVSNKLKDHYYLFSENAVYTLYKGQFPKEFRKTKILAGATINSQAFINRSEQYALLVGEYGGQGPPNPTLADELSVELINLATGGVTNLVKENPQYQVPLTSHFSDLLTKLSFYNSKYKIEETGSGFVIKDPSNQVLMIIDQNAKILVIK